MKTILTDYPFICAGFAMAVLALPAKPESSKPKAVNVMTFNIRYNNPADGANAWKHRKEWVAEIVKKQKADIVGMQEVLLSQLKDLKKRLPEMDVYGVGRDNGKSRGEHVPILFRRDRFQLLDKGTFWLSQTPEKPGSKDWDAAITRIASWVKLKDKNTGIVLYAINTHFDHRGKVARAKSAELLVQQLRKKFKDHPVVLTGDFNTTSTTTAYKTLVGNEKTKEAVFRDAHAHSAKKPTGPNSTWNGFRAIVPGRRIDFIFVSDKVKVLEHQTFDEQRKGKFPSDHLPILSKLELPKQ